MRGLIIMCLAVAASAQYNYQQTQASYSAPSSHGEAIASEPIGAPEEFQKEFYTFSAPENEFNDGGQQGYNTNSVKKNLRVIFIRGPENNGIENAAAQLAQQAGEDKTAIYVLQKQADIGGLVNQLQGIRSQSRPEVHFVKYRTQQDAHNAQHAIQAQYDSLPGHSQSYNGGTAPVLNFASQAQSHSAPAPQVPSQAYLPSALLRRRYRK